jgi:hypothetical protein
MITTSSAWRSGYAPDCLDASQKKNIVVVFVSETLRCSILFGDECIWRRCGLYVTFMNV